MREPLSIINVPSMPDYPSDKEVRDGLRTLLSQLRDIMTTADAYFLQIEVPPEVRHNHRSKITHITVTPVSPSALEFLVESLDHISNLTAFVDPKTGDILLHHRPTLETRYVNPQHGRTEWLTSSMLRQEGWPTLRKHDFWKLYTGLEKLSGAKLPVMMKDRKRVTHNFMVEFRFVRARSEKVVDGQSERERSRSPRHSVHHVSSSSPSRGRST